MNYAIQQNKSQYSSQYSSQHSRLLFKTRLLIAVLVLTLLPLKFSFAQQVTITDFPLGVGASVDSKIFQPYNQKLESIIDTLKAYPQSYIIITGSADGMQYNSNNDAINSGLALGRAHTLRNYLLNEFKVDTARIVVQSIDIEKVGGQYRSVSIRVVRDISDLKIADSHLGAHIDNVSNNVDTLSSRLEAYIKKSHEVGIRVGSGLTSAPFGAVPIIFGGVTWNHTVFIGGMVGHTFWNRNFTASIGKLETKRRLSGIQAWAFPFKDKKFGFVGGWIRIEEVSQDFHEYVQLSEGPILGAIYMPLDFLEISGVYNPSNHRIFESVKSDSYNGQFLFSLTAHIDFGGQK